MFAHSSGQKVIANWKQIIKNCKSKQQNKKKEKKALFMLSIKIEKSIKYHQVSLL